MKLMGGLGGRGSMIVVLYVFLFFTLSFSFSDDDDIAGVNSTTLDLLRLFFLKHPQPNSGPYPIPNTCEDAE